MNTNWEFGPILRAMMRNKVGAILIALQIAFTMTIVANGIFIIKERNEIMARDSGVDIDNSFHLQNFGYATDFDMHASVVKDLDIIRSTPGVIDAIQINAIPISGGGWSMGLQAEPGAEIDATGVAIYMVDDHGLAALDVELIAGENFRPEQIRVREDGTEGWPAVNIITQAMAESLFPDIPLAEVVGKTVYINDNEPIIVQGIIDKLQAPWIGWDRVENAMLSPEYLTFDATRYFIRTELGLRDSLMPNIEAKLADATPGRIIRAVTSMTEVQDNTFRRHRGMIKTLTTVMAILTIITAMGIVGLASFTVSRRKKQIGTRRALGASQSDILRYFMVENFIVSSFGVGLGAVLTIGLNVVLVNMFELAAIDWYFVPIAMVTLYLVGQLAVYGPAKRAANIPPALATRSV